MCPRTLARKIRFLTAHRLKVVCFVFLFCFLAVPDIFIFNYIKWLQWEWDLPQGLEPSKRILMARYSHTFASVFLVCLMIY